ncbi:N-acetyl-D-Glu racemase DgcA [Vibrio profundi]|uniref:N-acetyl-D-Glu racemase DgcA n=1 Tax=Vibrio profundi TaxID=1774960 RepID=UPI003734C182
MDIEAKHHSIKLAVPFSISRGTRTHVDVVHVSVSHQGHIGKGECTPYPRYGESVDSVLSQIETFRHLIYGSTESSRLRLLDQMPAGAARNALDCALWQLEAIQNNSDFPSPQFTVAPSIETAMTVSIASPNQMAAQAKGYIDNGATLLKIKLDDQLIVERIRSIRAVAPEAKLILDANEAWSQLNLEALFARLLPFNIAMIEQPLPKGQDQVLKDVSRPIPVCADESCHTTQDLEKLLGYYDMVNIKLDKSGGLTEALRLEQEARSHGLKIMVGCMLGTSLAMKAALPIANQAEIVDLDGPVLLGIEEIDGISYANGRMTL